MTLETHEDFALRMSIAEENYQEPLCGAGKTHSRNFFLFC